MRFIMKIFFLFLIATSMSHAQNKIKYPCSLKDKQELTSAINHYLDHGNSAISSSQVEIMRAQCLNDFASAVLHPKKNETDNAIVYLQKENKKWNVLILGTDFTDALDKFHIPKKLQEATHF